MATKDTHVLRVKQCLSKNEAFMRMHGLKFINT